MASAGGTGDFRFMDAPASGSWPPLNLRTAIQEGSVQPSGRAAHGRAARPRTGGWGTETTSRSRGLAGEEVVDEIGDLANSPLLNPVKGRPAFEQAMLRAQPFSERRLVRQRLANQRNLRERL